MGTLRHMIRSHEGGNAFSARAALGAALASLFVLLALGSAPASATSLCKAPENPECLPAKTYVITTNFTLNAFKPNPASFVVPGVTQVVCAETSARLKLMEAGTPLHSQITEMAFSSCKDSESKPCTVETRNEPLRSDIYKEGVGSWWGRVLLVPREGANPSWKLICTGGINCIYGHSELVEAVLKSGLAPALEIWRKTLELEQGSCPSTAEMTALYLFETSPIYVTLE